MSEAEVTVRPAVNDPGNPERDAVKIQRLLNHYAKVQLLLPRTLEDIDEKIGNFRVAEQNGRFVGCAALRDYGNSLYEVRSLAVEKDCVNRGIGKKMVSGILEQMRKRGESVKLFSLTYRADFFMKLGFRIVDKSMFPEKIWSDCVICSKKDRCDETAVFLEIN